MDFYSYNKTENVNGFSINDIYWVSADHDVIPRCDDKCATTTNTCTQLENNEEACYIREVYENGKLRNKMITNRSSNGTYIDSKNMYVYQILNAFNLGAGSLVLCYALYSTQ
jgi:hypothetical protein